MRGAASRHRDEGGRDADCGPSRDGSPGVRDLVQGPALARFRRLGPIERKIEVSLVSRPEMVYRMLLGRGALTGLLIDAGKQCVMARTPADAVA